MPLCEKSAPNVRSFRNLNMKPVRRFVKFDLTEFVLHLFFIILVALVVVPFVLLVSISLTDNNDVVQNGYRFFSDKVSFQAYQTLFESPRMIIDAYKVTLICTIFGSFFHFFTFFMYFSMLFSGGLVASYIINTQLLGFKDSYAALIVPLLFSPFDVIIIRTYFQTSLPKEIEESAKMDGATFFRIFFQIVLPLSAPVLATIGLFAALAYWNDWFSSLLYIAKDDMYSLQYVMLSSLRKIEALQRLLQMGASPDMVGKIKGMPTKTVQFAMVVVGIGPIILAYPFFQRFFVRGLTIGAVKG